MGFAEGIVYHILAWQTQLYRAEFQWIKFHRQRSSAIINKLQKDGNFILA